MSLFLQTETSPIVFDHFNDGCAQCFLKSLVSSKDFICCQPYCGMHGSGSNSKPSLGSSVAAETWPSSAMESHYFNKNQCRRRALWEGKRRACMCREWKAKGEGMCVYMYVLCVHVHTYKICYKSFFSLFFESSYKDLYKIRLLELLIS